MIKYKVYGGNGAFFCITNNGNIYTWGNNKHGQLGMNKHDNEIILPTLLTFNDNIKEIICGWNFTVFLTKTGRAYACGNNKYKQLGIAKIDIIIYSPELVTITDEKIVQVSCGASHSALLTVSGKLYICGDDRYNKLDVPTNFNEKIMKVYSGKYTIYVLTNKHELYGWVITDILSWVLDSVVKEQNQPRLNFPMMLKLKIYSLGTSVVLH